MTRVLRAIAIGPGLHPRQVWQPALQAALADTDLVGLDDIEAWLAQMESVSQY